MNEQSDLFDWKHLRLWRLSFIADFLSSIVIVAFVVLALGEAYRYNQLADKQFQTNLIGLFSQEHLYFLDVSLQMIAVLIQGVVYYLILKSVALGLNMIVETDINYREKKIEEGTE